MDIYRAKLLVATFEMDQLTARVQGGIPLENYIDIPAGHKCVVNNAITCGKSLDDSCFGCPYYTEKDGE